MTVYCEEEETSDFEINSRFAFISKALGCRVDLGVGFQKARFFKITIKIVRLRANKGITVLSKLKAWITMQSAALPQLQKEKRPKVSLFKLVGFHP